jgi:hypothetical protein
VPAEVLAGLSGEPTGHIPEEDTMTERPDTPLESGDEEDGSRASVGKDVGRPGGGRTEGETAVDDAMGQGTPPED